MHVLFVGGVSARAVCAIEFWPDTGVGEMGGHEGRRSVLPVSEDAQRGSPAER
jgi:hypothetical protein